MDEFCFSVHILPNRGATVEMATRSSFSVINSDRCFVFMAATAENPVYEAKPSLLCLINLDSRFSQTAKAEEVHLHKEPSHRYVCELLMFPSR